MVGPLRPCNLGPGTPCRGDDVALLSLRLVSPTAGSEMDLALQPRELSDYRYVIPWIIGVNHHHVGRA